MEGLSTELLNVGYQFECLHGGSPVDGQKKARRSEWKGGREVGEPMAAQSGVVRDVYGDAVVCGNAGNSTMRIIRRFNRWNTVSVP